MSAAADENHPVNRIRNCLILSYAASLPISLTASWIIFLVGIGLDLILLTIQTVRRIAASGKSPQNTKAHMPVLTLPLAIVALTVTASGALNPQSGGIFSTEAAQEAGRSFYSLKSILPYFWASFQFHRNSRLLKPAVSLLLLSAAIAGVWGSIQQVFDIHPTKFKYLQGTGFLSHPMAFAGQMQIFSFLGLGILLKKGYQELSKESSSLLHPILKVMENPYAFGFIVSCNFSGLFFAGERSAWLGAFLALLCTALLISIKFALKVMLAGAALFALAWFNVPLLRLRLESVFSGRDVSIAAREQIWGQCLQNYFSKSPIFGIGWLKFPHFDIPEAIVPGVSKDLNHAHSNYIQFLTTSGIMGLLSYLYLLFAILKAAYSKYKSPDLFHSGLGLGLFGLAVSLSVSGIFEYNFGTSQVRLAQWFVLALL